MTPVVKPPVKPNKPIDLTTRLEIFDTAGAATYRFFATQAEGSKGRFTYTAQTGTIDFYLNPGRTATIQTTGGAITVCYEPSLAQSISFASYSGTIRYCKL